MSSKKKQKKKEINNKEIENVILQESENSVEEISLFQKVNFSLKEGVDFLDSNEDVHSGDGVAVDEFLESKESEVNEDKEHQQSSVEKTFIEHDQVISILESVLFVSDKPVSMAQFKGVFADTNIGLREIKNGLEKLQSNYADVTRGFTLEEVTGGWQLRTKVDNINFLRRSIKARPFKLGGATLEVLSIIAYKQPIVKSEVDEIRGVESGHLIRALMERGLVNFAGKSDLPGKPMQYATTRKFLEIFGLRNLKELPSLQEIDQLIPEGIGEDEEKEHLSDITDNMSEAVTSSYSEGQEELEMITEKLDAIDTSSEFFEEEKRRAKAKKDKERAEDIRDALLMGEDVSTRDKNWLEKYETGTLDQEAQTVPSLNAETQKNEDITN